MRIFIGHNYYQQSGGEDAVVKAEQQLLQSYGHEVKLYTISNDQIDSTIQKIKTGLTLSYSLQAKKAFKQAAQAFQPDVVHLHNTFPLLTPSVYDACSELRVPVVQTLHNYRLTCAGALLMRNAKICELCVNSSPYYGALHGCYRGSKLQSLAVANMIARHRRENTWNTKVDKFIALTDFAKNKFVESGIHPKNIAVKPNFILPPPAYARQSKQTFALFVGRVSEEKGVLALCQAFNNSGVPLKIAGEGPLLSSLKSKAANTIEFLGKLPQQEVYKLMARAQFLVMPSNCYEGFPMVLLEAFAHQLPVLCTGIGSMAEIVDDRVDGLHFGAADIKDLEQKAQELYTQPEKCLRMGQQAYWKYKNFFNAEANYNQLVEIYQSVIR